MHGVKISEMKFNVSDILHESGLTPNQADNGDKNPFLAALGERVRALRARRGMTRKAVAQAAEVSERHLGPTWNMARAMSPSCCCCKWRMPCKARWPNCWAM